MLNGGVADTERVRANVHGSLTSGRRTILEPNFAACPRLPSADSRISSLLVQQRFSITQGITPLRVGAVR